MPPIPARTSTPPADDSPGRPNSPRSRRAPRQPPAVSRSAFQKKWLSFLRHLGRLGNFHFHARGERVRWIHHYLITRGNTVNHFHRLAKITSDFNRAYFDFAIGTYDTHLH